MTTPPILVGIDLGTTHSLCAVFREGRPILVPTVHGSYLTPSAVGVLDSGEIVVGEVARELSVVRPERCALTFKRWMGQDQGVELGDRRFGPAELSALVLRSLKQDAETFLGHPIEEAVITVPAYFNELQRRSTRQAGELAGLTVRRIVNEPTAAALAHGFHDRGGDQQLLVFDLGGGTFDVTVMEVFEGTLEIQATAGESRLGGEDFTDRILAWSLRSLGLELEHAEMTQPLRVARLRREAELAKRELGVSDRAVLRIPDDRGELDDASARLELGAAEFEELCTPLIERLRRPIERALRDAGKRVDQIDEVLLAGGATRMPVVRRMVSEMFTRPGNVSHDPDRVVALGAAVQAALILEDREVGDMLMTDVCPFTLGVAVTKDLGGRHVDGYFLPVIHRNTTIPVSREEWLSTLFDNQTTIKVRVFQGESRRIEENLELGTLDVDDLPPGPKGLEVALRFTYDLSGLLEVEVFVPSTGKKTRTVLHHHAKGLAGDEVAAALERMQTLKFYPREDLENQLLLQFAERVLKELDRFAREAMENAMDHYEHALGAGDVELFEAARTALLTQLAALGFPFSPPSEEPDS